MAKTKKTIERERDSQFLLAFIFYVFLVKPKLLTVIYLFIATFSASNKRKFRRAEKDKFAKF